MDIFRRPKYFEVANSAAGNEIGLTDKRISINADSCLPCIAVTKEGSGIAAVSELIVRVIRPKNINAKSLGGQTRYQSAHVFSICDDNNPVYYVAQSLPVLQL